MRKRYGPDWGGNRADQPTAHPLRQAGRAGSWIAELGIVSHETTIKKLDERLEFRKLVAQYSILVVIAGIVLGLVVVSG